MRADRIAPCARAIQVFVNGSRSRTRMRAANHQIDRHRHAVWYEGGCRDCGEAGV